MPDTNKYTVNKTIAAVDYVWEDQESKPNVEVNGESKRKPICILGDNGTLLVKSFDNKDYKKIIAKSSENILASFYVKGADLEKIREVLTSTLINFKENAFDQIACFNTLRSSDKLQNLCIYNDYEEATHAEKEVRAEPALEEKSPVDKHDKSDENTSLLGKNSSIMGEDYSRFVSRVNETIESIEQYIKKLSASKDELSYEKARLLSELSQKAKGIIESYSDEKFNALNNSVYESVGALSQHRNTPFKTFFWSCCSFFRPKPTSLRMVKDMLLALQVLQTSRPQNLSSSLR